MKEQPIKRKRNPRVPKKFIKYYFSKSSIHYNLSRDLDFLSFRNEPDEDMAHWRECIARGQTLGNCETYKAHYNYEKDKYWMGLGETANCLARLTAEEINYNRTIKKSKLYEKDL